MPVAYKILLFLISRRALDTSSALWHERVARNPCFHLDFCTFQAIQTLSVPTIHPKFLQHHAAVPAWQELSTMESLPEKIQTTEWNLHISALQKWRGRAELIPYTVPSRRDSCLILNHRITNYLGWKGPWRSSSSNPPAVDRGHMMQIISLKIRRENRKKKFL